MWFAQSRGLTVSNLSSHSHGAHTYAMRKTILLALAVTGLSAFASAQNAAQHQNHAASLLLNGKHEAACVELKQAAQLYRTDQQWLPYFSCLTQLTQAYLIMNNLALAKKTAKDALWQSISVLGRDNDEAAKAAHQLAQVYAAADRFEDAMQFHNMGLDIRTAMQGKFHPAVASSYSSIAATYQASGRLEQAEQYLAEALSILRTTYHSAHPETVPVLLQMGDLYKVMGETARAKSLYGQAVDIQQKAGAVNTDLLVLALVELAKLSSPDKSTSYFREAQAVIEEQDLTSGKAVGEVYLFAARAAVDQGHFATAAAKTKAAVQAVSLLPSHNEIRIRALRLSARCAVVQGHIAGALDGYRKLFRYAASLHPHTKLEAAKVALLGKHFEQAVNWSNDLVERDYGDLSWQARLVRAEAFLQLGQILEARAMLEAPIWKRAPSRLASRAYYLAAEVALARNAYGEAASRLGKGLAVVADSDFFTQLQLHATLGMLHVMLAEQDRNALQNLKRSKEAFEQYQLSLAALLEQGPFNRKERQWLDENQSLIYSYALESCFLLYQQQQDGEMLAYAFQYMESAKHVALQLEQSYWTPSEIGLRLQYLLEDEKTEEEAVYDQLLASWRQQQDRTLTKTITIAEFQAVLKSCGAQALSYFEGNDRLYVLHLNSGNDVLLRKKWPREAKAQLLKFAQLGSPKRFLDEGKDVSQLLLPSTLSSPAQSKKVVLLPAVSMLTFPFAALPLRAQLLGQRYEVYNHITGSAFVADYKQEGYRKDPSAAKVALIVDASEVATEAFPLPTKRKAQGSCQPALTSWVQQQNGYLLGPQEWMESQLQEIGLLTLPEWSIASLLTALPARPLPVDQLLLAEPLPVSERPAALLYALYAWQKNTGAQLMLYPDVCAGPDDLIPTVSGMGQFSGVAGTLLTLRQEEATNQRGMVWQIRIFGAPSSSKGQNRNIPVLWILCTVGGLILLGWWVKR